MPATQTSSTHRARTPWTAPLALALLALTGACNVIGAVAYKFSPPPTYEAQYHLGAGPTIVIVDRPTNPGVSSIAAQQIARGVTDNLHVHNVQGLLDPGLATERRSRRYAGDPTPLPKPHELARACGANTVVYVDLVEFDVSPAIASEAYEGKAQATVRVLDAETGEVLWPLDTTQGYPVHSDVPFTPTSSGRVSEQELRSGITDDLAVGIARLFYKWTAEGVDSGSPTE